jgi:uncharacterized protein YjbJ (UPF0337 family)
MNRNQVEGTAKDVAGKVQRKVGELELAKGRATVVERNNNGQD